MSFSLNRSSSQFIKLALWAITLGILGHYLLSGLSWRSDWEHVQNRGELRIAIRESEGIYWPEGSEFNGLEHDIIEALENELDVPVQLFAVNNLDDLYRAIGAGAVDVGLPGTSRSPSSSKKHQPYLTTDVGRIYKANSNITNADSTNETKVIGIVDPIAHQSIMQSKIDAQTAIASFDSDRSINEILTLLNLGDLDQVIMDERDFKPQQSIFPTLRFEAIEADRDVHFIYKDDEDGSISSRINAVLNQFEASELLNQITDRYYGEALEFDFVDNLTFEKHMASRLPTYIDLFKTYGEANGFDWRLLAAVAYQESHWRANARSPTGVRGLMMVTLNTAREMGIENRLDPEQSTQAGARYLATLKARIPEEITEPDRTWFALAAYNVGYGHLQDARKITELLEDNPNRWVDVRTHLPKLALKEYYPWTRYGFARGSEPVTYVANIRRFYERLIKEYPVLSDNAEPERLEQLPDAVVPVLTN